LNLKFNTKIIQNSHLGHYGVYIFENILENDYLKLLSDRTIELTARDEMHHQTNVKANMTGYQKLIYDKDFEGLRKYIMSFLKLCMLFRTPHWNVMDTNYVFADFWAMQFKKGEHTQLHTHMKADYSGVFCLRSDAKTQIYFPDLFPNSEILRDNTLYLFPGICPHSTTVGQSDVTRLSLAFNIINTNRS
jgi:hypothetical protein